MTAVIKNIELLKKLAPYLRTGENVGVIDGFNNRYYVTSIGRVFSMYGNTPREMKLSDTGRYYQVELRKNGVPKKCYVHRLVGIVFLNIGLGEDYINHIDGNGYNNDFNNLEWCTQKRNISHAYETGLRKPTYKKVIQCSLEGNFIAIRNSYKEAEEVTGANRQDIRKCILGIDSRKTAGGYIWKEFNLEEAIELLPDFTVDKFRRVDYKTNVTISIYHIWVSGKNTEGNTLLQAIEKMLEYLIDNDLLGTENTNS